MLKFYFFYIYVCIRGLFELSSVKSMLDHSVKKGKNHRITIRDLNKKIRIAKRKDSIPSFEHVYLWLLYSALNEDSPQDRANEFRTLHPLMVAWWYKLSIEKDGSSEMRE